MKPAPFSYHDPVTLDEAVALLAEHGDDAAVLAGGQSLVPLLSMRLARPEVVVDPRRVPGLTDVVADGSGVRCGALATSSAVELDPAVGRALPGLVTALGYVGHPQIRNRGTIGGSIAHADPAAELPALLVALDGTVALRSTAGARRVAAADLFVGAFTTTRRSDELLTEVHFPAFAGATTVEEVCRRPGDFALAGAACGLALADDGSVADARIALFGVGDRPVRAHDAEASLVGRPADATGIAEAARLATAGLDPPDDDHAPADYRRAVAAVVVERALRRLAGLAPGSDTGRAP
jgi:aerobic carbon-monoxide dehydrogenase medium subunit